MHTIHGRLLDLVRKLDAIGGEPSVVELAHAMHSTRLSRADVDEFVRPNPHGYNRATVHSCERYELLVMTWMGGQSSVPHDHAGSICVMQVVEGEAVEGSYRVSRDGYVDFDYETKVGAGQITSGQDAGVHTVRNASNEGQVLVTVHVYSPPLRDFRRFVPRPESLADSAPATTDATPTVVVVGGGFSGSTTAAQLLRLAAQRSSRIRVVLIERRGAVGEGLAYATREASHLLNVPAGRMSAWPDRPDDFVHWAAARHGQVAPHDFLPRQWFGEYVRETLLPTAREAGMSADLTVMFDEVRRVARRPSGGWMIHLATGTSLGADAVVLAIGHRTPLDPLATKWSGPRARFIADPWRPFALNAVKEGDPVVVLGSGLTAVDAVLSLASRGRISATLVSRNGLMPLAHASHGMPPVDMREHVARWTARPGGVRVVDVLRGIRYVVREVAKSGTDWRCVLDGLRPHTAAVWQAMPNSERRRFLTRLRPFWEVHRHRMALAVASQFAALRLRGEVRTIAARVVSAQADGNGARLILGERKTNRLIELDAAWVINCTGPAPSNNAAANPAIGSLLVDGCLRPDELGLGIETGPDGNAIDAAGHEVPDLFIVGTLRKPSFWESTAVPELRQQAATAAQRVSDRVARSARIPRPNFVLLPVANRWF